VREIWVVVVLAAGGCGRVGFDARPASSDAGGADSGAPPPLAWWKLDESSGTIAHDSAGALDGMWQGPGLAWEPTGGMVGGALAIPAMGALVTLGTPAELANLPALIVVAWIRPDDTSVDGNTHCFVDHGTPTAGWAIDHSQLQAGDLVFSAYFQSGVSLSVISAPGLLSPGTWAHVAMTWDGSPLAAGVHVYFDGTETAYDQQIDGGGPRPDDSQAAVSLGCSADTSFSGLLDDVRVYDRQLSAAEIARL